MRRLSFAVGYEVEDLEDRPTQRLSTSHLFNEETTGRIHSSEEYGVYYGLYTDNKTRLAFFVEEVDITRGWDARILILGGTSKSRQLTRERIEEVLN